MAPSRGSSSKAKVKPKKGANPLKAAAVAARQSGRPMPDDVDEGPSTTTTDLSGVIKHDSQPPLLTLLFADAATQHRALSRLEAFYEDAKRGRRYLTLREASNERLCSNYEAFNLPIDVVAEWLGEMSKREGEGVDGEQDAGGASGVDDAQKELVEITKATEGLGIAGGHPQAEEGQADSTSHLDAAWWTPYCTREESYVLDLLRSLGALPLDVGSQGASAASTSSSAPTYLISTLSSSKSDVSLAHERLHALYFLSPTYRHLVSAVYASLPSKVRSVIEHDLSMRGYARSVWEDEFQAYASLDAAEFGNRARDECQSVQAELRKGQVGAWREIGWQEPGGGSKDQG